MKQLRLKSCFSPIATKSEFPGCTHLELLNAGVVYFTYSRWNASEDLENYRNSALFAEVWSNTKALFAAPAEAWSTTQLF